MEILPDTLASPAWLLVGVTGARAVWLAWYEGIVTCSDERDVIFSVPFTELRRVRSPWYYFGGAFKLRIRATEYCLSFVKPDGADYVGERMRVAEGEASGPVRVRDTVRDIEEGRAAWRRWKEIFRLCLPVAPRLR